MDKFFQLHEQLNRLARPYQVPKLAISSIDMGQGVRAWQTVQDIRISPMVQETYKIARRNADMMNWGKGMADQFNAAAQAFRPIINTVNHINSLHTQITRASALATQIPDFRKIAEMPTSSFANLAAKINRQNPAQFAIIVDRFSAQPLSIGGSDALKGVIIDGDYSDEPNDAETQPVNVGVVERVQNNVRNVLSNEYIKAGFLWTLYIGFISWGVNFDIKETLATLGESYIATKIPTPESKKVNADN